MQEPRLLQASVTIERTSVPEDGWGAGRLRDADWLPPAGEMVPDNQAQLLHRWPQAALVQAASVGLFFQSIDGNPRHGVLALIVDGALLQGGVIEILERQGQWLVMPNAPRARLVAEQALARSGADRLPRSRIAGTRDRRFIFFNTPLDGGLATRVERRRDVVVAIT